MTLVSPAGRAAALAPDLAVVHHAAVAACFHPPLHHHDVCLGGNDGTRHDPDGFIFTDATRVRVTGECVTNHAQSRYPVGGEVGSAHGITLHGGVAVRGNIERGNNGPRQDPAEGFTDR